MAEWVCAIRLINYETGEVREVSRFNSAAVKTMLRLCARDIKYLREEYPEDVLRPTDLVFEVPRNKRLEEWLNQEKDRRHFKEEVKHA